MWVWKSHIYNTYNVCRSQPSSQALVYAQGMSTKKGSAKSKAAKVDDDEEDYLGGENEEVMNCI